jgi:hypothetical protein
VSGDKRVNQVDATCVTNCIRSRIAFFSRYNDTIDIGLTGEADLLVSDYAINRDPTR